jgi:GDP/UDP-N,N'-diacetylbacillosamine 2-epimerase (hydrolysing)
MTRNSARGKRRTICVISGTRAEYGCLYPIMKMIRDHPRLKLKVAVTGMHLEEKFGMTVKEIEHDGFRIDARVPIGPLYGDEKSVAKSIGKGIIGFTDILDRMRPDFLLIMGDRFEALSAVIAATFLNIPVAHLSGGDSAKAGLDEPTRHSISKFASLHFVGTKNHAKRLIRMGEDRWRIFVAGEPTLDTILHRPLPSREALEKELGISLRRPTILVVQHSVSTQPKEARGQIRETLKALRELGLQTVIIYPNADAGGAEIIDELERWDDPFLHKYRSLPYTIYLSLLKQCAVMVGNSSSGIVESSSFKLPVVNIGTRQQGRERAANVIDVGYDHKRIAAAIRRAISPSFRKGIQHIKNPYGDGHAAERICKVLATIKITKELIQKKLAY